ncbi:mitochondrial metalloendopeptidase OMA1-like isoform X2 [Salvia miltiorrhiza]|uniref:mitochondrial metalloendopeptidase OMA1-like isoform X2 n=1 Tax=Salvia miltiorrhiza TaxID=226208 RepID=UPI0025AC83A0|nr:mitochondrial metalloendopeptidase OMA1-like isoform X2 [Salvia miltiorrhiza]
MAAVLIEEMIKETWLNFLMHFIRVWFLEPDIVVDKVLDLFLRLPHSRRTEMEADYIGLMVMASAGYDPRKAPLVWKKFEEMSETSLLGDFISTHPSCEKRCRLLSQPQVMEEALAIYRDMLPTSWSAMARLWLDNLIKP